MVERVGDIWGARQPDDWVVITTNGTLRKDGKLVMGRGIAYEASQRYPHLQGIAGKAVQTHGLKLFPIYVDRLILFPVKYEFYQKADVNLILKSTVQLVELLPTLLNNPGLNNRILMPRPGCGNGKLDWAEVEPMMRQYLTNDRIIIFRKGR